MMSERIPKILTFVIRGVGMRSLTEVPYLHPEKDFIQIITIGAINSPSLINTRISLKQAEDYFSI